MTNERVFFFLIAIFLGTAIDVGSTQESECNDDNDCRRPHYKEVGKCQNNFCICKDEKNVSKNCSAVETKPKQIGENYFPCKIDEDCFTEIGNNSHCISSHQCDCKPDYHLAKNNTCIKNKNISAHCNPNDECNNIVNSTCYEKNCNCSEGTILSLDKNMCLPKAENISDPCDEEAQCISLAGTNCTNGTCQCPNNHHYNQSLSSCILYKNVDEACSYDDECSEGEKGDKPTICFKGACKECRANYFRKNGKCSGASSVGSELLSILLSIILLFISL